MLNSIKRAGFRFRVGTSDPSRGTLVEPKYFQVLGLIWNAYLGELLVTHLLAHDHALGRRVQVVDFGEQVLLHVQVEFSGKRL